MKINQKISASLSIFTLLLFFILTACTENIDDISFNKTNARLVVDGTINTDTTTHRVILSKTSDALNLQKVDYVSNAIVTITQGTDTFVLKENPTKRGVYETEPTVYGVVGKTYKLNISNVDVNNDGVLENYSAVSEIRPQLPLDRIEIKPQIFDADYKGWNINLYAREIGGGKNYYLIKIHRNNKLLTDSTREYSISNNIAFEGKYYAYTVYFLNDRKVDERLVPGDIITLELDAITEDYFDFISAFQQEYRPKTPIFDGPSANIPTNIEPAENAVGIFAAYSKETVSALVTEKEMIKKD